GLRGRNQSDCEPTNHRHSLDAHGSFSPRGSANRTGTAQYSRATPGLTTVAIMSVAGGVPVEKTWKAAGGFQADLPRGDASGKTTTSALPAAHDTIVPGLA